MTNLAWEYLDLLVDPNPIGKHETYLYRARVPGGWLVLANNKFEQLGLKTAQQQVSITYVPDPGYQWTIGQPNT